MPAPFTRFGLEGYGVRRVVSFAGKTPSGGGGTHPVGLLTRLGMEGYGVRRASSFAGKASGGVTGTTLLDFPFISNMGKMMGRS